MMFLERILCLAHRATNDAAERPIDDVPVVNVPQQRLSRAERLEAVRALGQGGPH